MLNVSSNPPLDNTLEESSNKIRWNPWVAVIFMLVVFFTSQVFAAVFVSLYPAMQKWSSGETEAWLSESVYAQFSFVLIAEVLAIGAIYLFIRHYRHSWQSIGLIKPRFKDLLIGLAAVPVYFLLYIVTATVISMLVPELDLNQEQQIGFENVQGLLPLILTFISLAVLPPLAEEIMVRGFLYTSLKKAMPVIGAVVLTSLIFAAAHLPAGGDKPLWIAAIDTFILSLVLIYLREKTGSLWASITLHAAKNSVAFVVLFVIGSR